MKAAENSRYDKGEKLRIHAAEMKQAVAEAADLFGRGGDPQEIDIIMDKACFSQIADAAEKSGDDFLIGFVRLQIDINNIKSFMRLRQIGKSMAFFPESIPGAWKHKQQTAGHSL